ncbi:hypothetical protein FRC17_002733 [Serendipita sp. 399]|nr:hypothetical protein FRC17_002733 [Serendipita sp. 399]
MHFLTTILVLVLGSLPSLAEGTPLSSITPTETAPASPTTMYRGIIEVLTTNPNEHFGYIGGLEYVSLIGGPQVIALQSNESLAGTFTFQAPSGATAVSQVDLESTTPLGGYPVLGLIEGSRTNNNNLEPGSSNYVNLGGTLRSAPGATAQTGPNSYAIRFYAYQSSVWSINISTGDMVSLWVNKNNNAGLGMDLFAWKYTSTFMMGTGDFEAFKTRYPNGGRRSTSVKLRFLPRP